MASTRSGARSLLATTAAALVTSTLAATIQQGEGPPRAESIRLELRPTQGKADRPLCVASLMWPKVRLAHRGELELEADEQHEAVKIDVYLPKLRRFPLVNPGKNDSSFENKAAFLYVDQDGDGELVADEAWFCNLPFRVDDRMLEVTAIAKDGTWFEFRSSNAALAGAVRGRSLPTLSFATMSGKQVLAPREFLGKHLVIQVWSPT